MTSNNTSTNSSLTPPADSRPWHVLSATEAVQALKSDASVGLGDSEARERLAVYGPNALREKPPRPLWAVFLDQFRSLLILILIGAAALAGAIGSFKDSAVILIVTMINAVLGVYQESRAEQSLLALKKMLPLHARVRRDGRELEVSAEQLVPGDLVLLETGVKIPADGRLLQSESLEIDESALTGESLPVAKSSVANLEPEAQLADRATMAFTNTMVTRGRGEMLVIATGATTEIGRLAEALAEAEEPATPLQIQLDRLGKRLSIFAGAVIAVIFTLNMLGGKALVASLLEAIALAVAAIPEGLPAVVTVTLSLGMQRMARNRAIVKRLAAVETLGCTTVTCSDKTGTLTLNQMTAKAFFFDGRRFSVSGEGYQPEGGISLAGGAPAEGTDPLLKALVLCNDSQVTDGQVLGDPLEGALLVLGAKGGLAQDSLGETYPRIGEIPFDSGRKYMATFHQNGAEVTMMVKGAPEVLTAQAGSLWSGGEALPMDNGLREGLVQQNSTLAQEQLRVIGVGTKSIPAKDFQPKGDLGAHLKNLTMLGLVGLADPPRPEAREAIALCHRAGIDVKMITGDHQETATAIARQLGLSGGTITGQELDQISVEDLAGRVGEISVFARVAPSHKVRIVEALQARGQVVAMTGDGVNDAPALKRAHIGVAMGKSGTEVAKEAATMVLTDDNFATIVGAVYEGRTIYDNIVKFVRFQLSTNIGAIFSMLVANLAGLPAPFNPIQILWVNIIMDGPPAMAMGLEPARAQIMQDSPRDPDAQILSWGRIAVLMLYGTVMVCGTLGMLVHGMATQSMEKGLSMAFATFVLFQIFNAFNARVEKGSFLGRHMFKNPVLWGSLVSVLLLQVGAMELPFLQSVFHTTSLSTGEWGLTTAVAASVLVVGEAQRALATLIGRLRTAHPPTGR